MSHYQAVKGQPIGVCIYSSESQSIFVKPHTNMISIYSLCFFIGSYSVFSAPIYLELDTPTPQELSFMTRYGYLPELQSDFDFAYTPQSISEAVMKVQAFAGLPQTGKIDTETKKLFRKRRCGVQDIETEDGSSRSRRYILQQGWNKKSITYRVINGASTLEKSRVEAQMAAGLDVWAPHGGLRFSKVDKDSADIEVSFARGKHGDMSPFDGPGHVVAHAFAPPYGAMHFDDDEIWSDNLDDENEDVTNFFAVAVHEIGHSLGLSHSRVKASVMYPYYQVPVEKLHVDDILGIEKLYAIDQLTEVSEEPTESPDGSRSSQVPRFTKADTGDLDDDVPDLCFTNYDTIQVIQGKIYVFEEKWMWVLPKKGVIEHGYPKRFHDVFVGLPEHVNRIKTIYEKKNGNIVVFSGRDYWEFDQSFHFIREGNVSEYAIPTQVPVSTVFISNYNNKTYLIEYEGERFWRFDEETHTMDQGYPKEMTAWRFLPYPVDAAIIWEGDTFFFRGPRFWRFDNKYIRAHEYYPLPTAQVWFSCPANSEMNNYITNDQRLNAK